MWVCVFDVKVYFIYIVQRSHDDVHVYNAVYTVRVCDNIVCEFNVCRARAFKPFDAIAQTLYALCACLGIL